jgi:two-component system phosphate regulon response regulator OmpR
MHQPRPSQLEPGAGSKPTVLVVEDVDLLRRLLQEYLEEDGYTVRTAGTCAAAQRIVARSHLDAVISDIRLPDGSGVAFCEVLRVADPQLGIVMMTGFANEPIPEWIDGGRVPLLNKPLDLVRLSDSVRAVLRRQ